MFLHFGISTYDGNELSDGTLPASAFNPTKLDVEQWVNTIKEAGMRYAVLTTKHVAGFCLWPTEHTDYHIGASPVGGDLVGDFVAACHKHGIRPGLYYCSWDNHHTFGAKSVSQYWQHNLERTFSHVALNQEYLDFQKAQLTELLQRYPDLEELWIDIPLILPMGYRRELYEHCASLQPNCLIIMNNGIPDKQGIVYQHSWPTDVVTIERDLPKVNGIVKSQRTSRGWETRHEYCGEYFYLPAEICDTMGMEWFYEEDDEPRSTLELASMYGICRSRGANLLLDVGPTPEGLIHDKHRDGLFRLRECLEKNNWAA